MLAMPENSNVEALVENAERAAQLLRSIGSKWRLLVLCQLVKGEKSVGQLESIIGLSQSALSQHLAVLRTAGVIRTRREGKQLLCSLAMPQVKSACKLIRDVLRTQIKNRNALVV